MMRLFDMTEQELAGEIFVNTPFSWPFDKSRSVIEEMAKLLGWDALSPASVWSACMELNKRLYEKHQKK